MTEVERAKHIHLVGIGGCSMSGIACILKAQGHTVTGSDREATQFTPSLDRAGIPWTAGHGDTLPAGTDLVIYSAAIKPENPERAYARARGIPELERSVALGQISEGFDETVAIAGCHGKTTVTSMLTYVLERAGHDATVHVGGFMDLLGGGVRMGGRELFLTEACEYVESFLTLSPTVALINNIDNDHLDYYKNFDNIVRAFEKFLARLPEDGTFIACVDDPTVKKLLAADTHRQITYGMAEGADYTPRNIRYDENGCPSFEVIAYGASRGTVELRVPGAHNIVNALGVIAVAERLRIPFASIAEGLNAFVNTKRRFEFFGERDGIRVYHDYGHHPNEIRATLAAAKNVPHNRLFCVFQCNSFTRAKTLFCENVTCFGDADKVLVADIYPGREKDTGIVHARDMAAGINSATGNALYLGTFEAMRDWLDANGQPGDLVVTVGSGDVYKQTRKLL